MAYFETDELRVASPCSASWAEMKGSDTVRSCAHCEKNVYNLSLLTRAEVSELIREKEGKLCIRFYKRFDGTILTVDCPKGLRFIRKSYLKTRFKVITLAMSIAAILSTFANSCRTASPSDNSAMTAKKATPDSLLSNPKPPSVLSICNIQLSATIGDGVYGGTRIRHASDSSSTGSSSHR